MRKEILNLSIMLVAFLAGLIVSIGGDPLMGVFVLIAIMYLPRQVMKLPPLRSRLPDYFS